MTKAGVRALRILICIEGTVEFWFLTALAKLRGVWTDLGLLNACSAPSSLLNPVLSVPWTQALTACAAGGFDGVNAGHAYGSALGGVLLMLSG